MIQGNFDMICTEIHYDYQPSVSDGREIFGEEWKTDKVGENGVTAIIEHPCHGEGDRWFYDVIKDDGTAMRIFYPNKAFYKLP